jgi:hypothetical protein
VKTKCCRSTPRCAGCPVRAGAAARKYRELGEPAALTAEIFAVSAPRVLPPSVAAALASLELARMPR